MKMKEGGRAPHEGGLPMVVSDQPGSLKVIVLFVTDVGRAPFVGKGFVSRIADVLQPSASGREDCHILGFPNVKFSPIVF